MRSTLLAQFFLLIFGLSLIQAQIPDKQNSIFSDSRQPATTWNREQIEATGTTVLRDVGYCTTSGTQIMDVYLPGIMSDRPLPALIYIHGGAWSRGDKANGPGMDDIPELLARGYVIASINYRLSPANLFPAHIEDCKCAVRSLRANAKFYNVDVNRIGVWGSSAGGHLASLVALADTSAGWDNAGNYLDQSSKVLAAAPLFPPSDLTTSDWSFIDKSGFIFVFGTTGKWAGFSPVNFVTKNAPPFFLVGGEFDSIVSNQQPQALYAKLQAAKIPSQFTLVKNSEHEYAPSGGLINPSRTEMTKRVADFFDRYVKLAPTSVSAASYLPDYFSPGGIVSIFGDGFTTLIDQATSLPLPSVLSGVKVTILDVKGIETTAQLFYISPTQINFYLPTTVAPGRALIRVTKSNGEVLTGMGLINTTAPALFTADSNGQGYPAANVQHVNANNQSVFENVSQYDSVQGKAVALPIQLSSEVGAQEFLLLYGTGWRNRNSNVTATIGGLPVEVLYAGAQGTYVGLDQINLRLPLTLKGKGNVELNIFVDGKNTNPVRLFFS